MKDVHHVVRPQKGVPLTAHHFRPQNVESLQGGRRKEHRIGIRVDDVEVENGQQAKCVQRLLSITAGELGTVFKEGVHVSQQTEGGEQLTSGRQRRGWVVENVEEGDASEFIESGSRH